MKRTTAKVIASEAKQSRKWDEIVSGALRPRNDANARAFQRKSITSIVILLIALVATGIAQTSILIYDFKATGMDEATVSAIHELFKAELSQRGYNCKDAFGEVCTDATCAAKGAKNAEAQQALYGTIFRLGEKIILTIYVADNAEKIIHTDKISSETVEDLDAVVARLARGIAEGKQTHKTIDKTNIVAAEAEIPLRRKNYFTLGGKTGYRLPLGDSYSENRMWQCEAVAIYELEKFFVEGRGIGYGGSDAYGIGFTVGAFYIFSPNDFTPYIGGAAGVEWLFDVPYTEKIDTVCHGLVSGNGPTLNFGGGLMAFQTYDFRLFLDIRYCLAFIGEGDINWSEEDEAVDIGTEQAISVTLGITHGR